MSGSSDDANATACDMQRWFVELLDQAFQSSIGDLAFVELLPIVCGGPQALHGGSGEAIKTDSVLDGQDKAAESSLLDNRVGDITADQDKQETPAIQQSVSKPCQIVHHASVIKSPAMTTQLARPQQGPPNTKIRNGLTMRPISTAEGIRLQRQNPTRRRLWSIDTPPSPKLETWNRSIRRLTWKKNLSAEESSILHDLLHRRLALQRHAPGTRIHTQIQQDVHELEHQLALCRSRKKGFLDLPCNIRKRIYADVLELDVVPELSQRSWKHAIALSKASGLVQREFGPLFASAVRLRSMDAVTW